MTDREAMKMALEALEWCLGGEPCGGEDAVRALKERLAQPEQWEQFYPDMGNPLDRMAENARELGLDYEPVQEPVAWLESEPSTKNWPLRDLFTSPMSMVYSSRWHVGSKKPDASLGNRLTPLYTTPPRREWRGLTEEEIGECTAQTFHDVYRRIEAKLKEKNENAS